MGYGEIGKGIGNLITWLFIIAAIAVPLAIWKLVEIAIWICQHVKISW